MTFSHLLVVITVGGLWALPIPMASAQVGGMWTIAVDTCCTSAEGTECESDTMSITVAQNGNQLSGWSLDSADLPAECGNVTCTPAIPRCDGATELAGTVSGDAVDLTLTGAQSLHASCAVMGISCLLEASFAGVVHAQGTVSGQTIEGSFNSQETLSCQLTGAPECEGALACTDAQCTGSFHVVVGQSCMGDCVGDSRVTVDEVLAMVNIALGSLHVATCGAGDANGDDQITVDEILTAVNYALSGCA